jgi:hypothetical protein
MSENTNCAAIAEQLTALSDAELSAAGAASVRAHLEICPNCAALYDELSRLRTLTEAWQISSADRSEAILSAIQSESQRRTQTERQNISNTEIIRARAEAQNLPFIDLAKHHAESSALQSVPGEIARRFVALPVRRDGYTLYVAMQNPRDIMALDELRRVSGCHRICPMLAEPNLLRDALHAAYAVETPPIYPVGADDTLSVLVAELRLLRNEMQAARAEITALRNELSELRRTVNTPTTTVSRYIEVLPYATPTDTPLPLR